MSRFLIRPYREQDVAGLYAAADESRREIARWMGWMSDAYSPEDTAAWVRQAIDSWQAAQAYEHVITDATDSSIVGACGLNLMNRVNGFCNLGYWVRASRFGEGAGRAATLQLRDFAFGTLGLNRLEIVIADGNHFSRHVAESAGAKYEGVREMRLAISGLVHDAHMYVFLNPAAHRAARA